MELKKLILVLAITMSIVIGIMFGISYSWYAYSNAETEAVGKTIKETPTVIFAQNEFISVGNTMPIDDMDRYNYANKNSFSITLNENLKKYQVGIKINLVNIKISDELKISNYKYELLMDGKVVSNGNFNELNSTELELLPMTVMNSAIYPKTYNYELYIWLSDDGSNQNNLMNKGISAKINVVSAVKKG